MKTLLELQERMGRQIDKLDAENLTPEEMQTIREETSLVIGIGKQMINNADMMLRYEKLQAQNRNLVHSSLKDVIGY